MTESKTLTTSEAQREDEWNQLTTLIAEDAKKHDYFEAKHSFQENGGKLIVIGSGIRCVGQFTLESHAHIKKADKVLYVISDPVTEAYVRELRPDALDLYVLYGNDKRRHITYTQMAEACLYFARKGNYTVAIFYGHPGVFCWPVHRMLRVAKMQGIPAQMLPGISAEDCLLADLGIDPSHNGLQSLEATDLLIRDRQLLTDSNIIIWQVGCVGEVGFNFKGYSNRFLGVLINKLQQVYGKDYEIIHYIGAHYSIYEPVTERIPLSDFHKPEVSKKVTGISTFFVPPKEVRPVKKDVCELLQITADEQATKPRPMPTEDKSHQYAKPQKDAVSELSDWKVPRDYVHVQPTMAARYLARMSTDPEALEKHKQDPSAAMNRFGLSSRENQLIKNRKAFVAVKSSDGGTGGTGGTGGPGGPGDTGGTPVTTDVTTEEAVVDAVEEVVIVIAAKKESVVPGTIPYV